MQHLKYIEPRKKRKSLMFFIHDLMSITIKPANIKKYKLQIQHKIYIYITNSLHKKLKLYKYNTFISRC